MVRATYRDAPGGDVYTTLGWFASSKVAASQPQATPTDIPAVLVELSVAGRRQMVNPRDDIFLRSYEWRRLRMLVLTERGNRCECCGASPTDGATVLNVDHIKPRRKHPQLALVKANLQVLCNTCNEGKGNWDETDWRTDAPVAAPLPAIHAALKAQEETTAVRAGSVQWKRPAPTWLRVHRIATGALRVHRIATGALRANTDEALRPRLVRRER